MSASSVRFRGRVLISHAFVFGVAALAIPACRATDHVQPEVAPLTVTGDSSVGVSQDLTLTAIWDTLKVPSSERLVWTSSDMAVAFATGAWDDKVSVIGRRAGVTTVTASNAAGAARHVVTVRDDRPVIRDIMGDSIAGQLVNGVAKERASVTLAMGDTIDIAVTTSDGERGQVPVERTGSDSRLERVLLGPRTSIYGMVPWTGPGTIDFEVTLPPPCTSRACSLPYKLHVRRSAPIFHSFPYSSSHSLPQGGSLRDTTWVQNVGVGSTTATVSSSVPWLRPDAASVTVVGPSAVRQPGGPVPAGAATVAHTIDASTVTPGTYFSSLRMDVPSGVWTSHRLANRTDRFVSLRVYDSTVRVISRTAALSLLAASPDGRLYGARGDSVFIVDPSSGSTTPLVSVTRGGVKGRVYQLSVGFDSALYVGVWLSASDSIYRVTNGALTPVLGWTDVQTGPFAVTADGSVYAFHKGQLFRRGLDGSPELMASIATMSSMGLVYRRADDALYFIGGNQLMRYDIGSRAVEARAGIEQLHSPLLVDAGGRLYAKAADFSTLLVLDTTARVLDRFVAPESIFSGVAISSTTIFGSSEFGTARLWRIPLR